MTLRLLYIALCGFCIFIGSALGDTIIDPSPIAIIGLVLCFGSLALLCLYGAIKNGKL